VNPRRKAPSSIRLASSEASSEYLCRLRFSTMGSMSLDNSKLLLPAFLIPPPATTMSTTRAARTRATTTRPLILPASAPAKKKP
jgi:hypothetical protein